MYKDYLIPFNEEAEYAVLGSCFIDPEAIGKVASQLTPQDFYREKNRWIFEAMLELHREGKPTDQVTVAWVLAKRNHLEALGGAAYISFCVSQTPTSAHVVYYAEIVKECSERRQQIIRGKELIAKAYSFSTEPKAKKKPPSDDRIPLY